MQLKAEKLSVGYGSDKVVFGDITFAAGAGDIIALLGVNGIGKSTLLRTICGLQPAISGHIEAAGQPLINLNVQQRAQLISIVLTERIYVDNILVREFIALGRMPYTNWLGRLSNEDEQEVQRVIEVMKIAKLEHKLFNELSDGEKQKVLIARALCQQTPVIIMDEPTAFLDFRNKKEILELLAGVAKELNKTIILSTHDIETSLNYCTKCWIMTEKKTFVEIARTDNFKNEIFSLLFR